MLVSINRNEMNSLDDATLGSTCFRPLIQAFKELRMNNGDEAMFYSKLSNGQQALFMFRVYYGHVSKSPEDLYWWSAYFLAQPGKWSALKERLAFLSDHDAITLLQEIEGTLAARNYPRQLDLFDVTMKDLERDSELLAVFNDYYVRYMIVAPHTINRIAQYIRNNWNEFVSFSDH